MSEKRCPKKKMFDFFYDSEIKEDVEAGMFSSVSKSTRRYLKAVEK